MSSYFYFSNNLKDIKGHIQADMISCKIFFQLMITFFKEKLNLQLPLIFHSSTRIVFETAFISEEIAENSSGALLGISDTFITKFNVFSYMIWQFKLKTVWKISKPYCMLGKTVARQFYLKGHCLYHKIRDELLETRKEKAQRLLSPYKVQGNLFQKKVLHEGTNFFWQIFGEMFYMGTNDQIMQGGKLMVKRFQMSSQVSFSFQ